MINNTVFDNGLSYLQTNADTVYLCTTEPTTYTQASSTYAIANKTVSLAGPSDATGGGRKVTVPAITDGAVTALGTPTHVAVTGDTELLVTVTIPEEEQEELRAGNKFELTSFDIGIQEQ